MPMKPQTDIQLILEVTSLAVGLSAPPIIPMEADSELQPNKPSVQTNVKMHATNFFIPITPCQILIYSSVLSFYRQFRLCIAKVHRAKPIPPCRAGVYSRRLFGASYSSRRDASIFRFAQCQVCFANIAPALRCNPIIPQIGREYNISAEICL